MFSLIPVRYCGSPRAYMSCSRTQQLSLRRSSSSDKSSLSWVRNLSAPSASVYCWTSAVDAPHFRAPQLLLRFPVGRVPKAGVWQVVSRIKHFAPDSLHYGKVTRPRRTFAKLYPKIIIRTASRQVSGQVTCMWYARGLGLYLIPKAPPINIKPGMVAVAFFVWGRPLLKVRAWGGEGGGVCKAVTGGKKLNKEMSSKGSLPR